MVAIEISDWDDLDDIRLDLDAEYILVNDLDSSTTGYTGIGDDWAPIGTDGSRFTGTFDGDGHTISDIDCSQTLSTNYQNAYLGLFGVGQECTIKKVGIIDSTIETIISGTPEVTGSYIGALIGSLWAVSYVENCYMNNCTVTGRTVDGTMATGGLIGVAWGFDPSWTEEPNDIDKCYGVGSVTSSATGTPSVDNIGGVLGWSRVSNDSVTNSFFDEDVITGANSTFDGTGKTTSQMKDIDTYTDTATTGLDEAWDFTTLWAIDSGINEGYPYFGISAGTTVGVKIGGTFEQKPLMIKKSGVFEPASGLTVM